VFCVSHDISQNRIRSNPNAVPTIRPAGALQDHDGGSPAFLKLRKIRQQELERQPTNGLHLLFAFFNKVRQTAWQ